LLEENKDKELSCEILRNGSKMTVTITPEKRPEPTGAVKDRMRWLAADGDKAVEGLRKHLEKAGAPMRMQIFHPGIMIKGDGPVAKFPEDLHVHVHKHGNKPAEIVVERGDKKWTLTEDKLGELPEDVRPHIEALLGRVSMPKFDVELDAAPIAGAPVPFNIPLPPPGEFSERIEKRLEEMNRRMEQLREQLDDMRDERRENRQERREDREEDRESTREDA
jgi:hypothetical protein